MIGFIIFALLAIAALIYQLYKNISLIKTPMVGVDFKKVVRNTILFSIIFGLLLCVMLIFGAMWKEYPLDASHYAKLIGGGVVFGFSIDFAVNAFILHYYGKNLPEKLDKTLFYGFIAFFVLAFLSMFLMLDGYAPYFEYPLVNGISFSDGFVTPKSGRPNVAFYAICILSGALLVYAMCDHFMYKEYGEHGILESTFLVAFPAGIIGARLWYCIGDNVPIQDWIRIWDGGLTILGGAIMGIVVGVAWFLWRNKKYSIWIAVDVIVPTILIAQAVGRFGNFFNCEVHGELTSIENFKWLPEIIWRNMTYSDTLGYAPEGQMYVPLFFIEAFTNFIGYFVIAHLFGKKFNKVLEPGDLCGAYVIWYGLTRVLMEPLRNSHYNMGENGFWSWVWSLVFVAGGMALILVNHIIRLIIKNKNNTYSVKVYDKKLGLIESICFGVLFIGLMISGICLTSANEFTNSVKFSSFNVGLIFITTGVCFMMLLAMSLIRFVKSIKVRE